VDPSLFIYKEMLYVFLLASIVVNYETIVTSHSV